MNIFVLNEDPCIAAQMHCDKHVVKMVVESTQLLCSVHHLTNPRSDIPYKLTHPYHPCSVWVRKSIDNYKWLLEHAGALNMEYTYRYNKKHACTIPIMWCMSNMPPLPELGLTPFAQAMPDQYKDPADVVKAYQDYYHGEKAYMAKWNKTRSAPSWW